MRIQLNIDDIILNDPDNYLKQSDKYLGPIFRCMSTLPYWTELKYYGIWGAKLKKIKSFDSLIKDSELWKNKSYILASENTSMPMASIVIDLYSDSIKLQLSIGEPFKYLSKEHIIDDFISFTQLVFQTFQEKAIIGPTIGIKVSGIEYPRPKPPHLDHTWERGQVVNFISTKFHNQSEEGRAEQVRILEKSILPANVKKIEFKDLLIYKWIDNVIDTNEIINALSSHDLWFSETLELPIDSSYNELGDEHEMSEILEDHKYLTFYNSFTGFGYKGVVLNPDGSMEDDVLKKIQSWTEKRITPDGTVLKELILITPDRESALITSKIFENIGGNKVVYVDNDDEWWNPNPPGLWLE